MVESEDSTRTERRDEAHDRWLVMQSAFTEYRRASEALESADESIADSATQELVRLGMLERAQRVAFERYVEARVDYVEFQYDSANRRRAAQAGGSIPDTEGSRIVSCFVAVNRILPVLSIVLLCVMGLWLAREHKRVRALEDAGDELRIALQETRAEIRFAQQQPVAERQNFSRQPSSSLAEVRSGIRKSPARRVRGPHSAAPTRQKQAQNASPLRKSTVRKSERTTATIFR